MDIKLENCNSIDSGEICIEKGLLNIKYALNGTGKSTIAHAIAKSILGENLNELCPFKYSKDDNPSNNPSVLISDSIKKVATFNEEYIDNYTFKKDELIENSFEIFVKTENYEKNMQKISELINSIKTTFSEDPEFDKLISDLNDFIDSFGKAKSGYSKAGKLEKTIGQGNKLENIPEELNLYAPYLKNKEKNLNWVKWQSEGQNYMDITEKCPFCVSTITTPEETILGVSKEYNTKYLNDLSKILDIFSSLGKYFSEETNLNVQEIASNALGTTEEQKTYLIKVKEEVIELRDKLKSVKDLSFITLSNVDTVVIALNELKINLKFYPFMNSEYTNSKIDKINSSIDIVIKEAAYLQGQINIQKGQIRQTIEQNKNDIDDFLKAAGYPYRVSISESENKNYRLVLKYGEQQEDILNVKQHLSYGERNAFALILFMYQSLNDNADFIILDDPISSFDMNKKYVIMKRLFKGKNSFQGKTVLLLTHDLEPIIDLVCVLHRDFPSRASFVINKNGLLSEKSISPCNVQSFFQICNDNISTSDSIINKLIYYRRLLEGSNIKDKRWELISNIFHGDRVIPLEKDEDGKFHEMSREDINDATKKIQQKIPEFDYDKVYELTTDKEELIRLFHSSESSYEKLQIYRILQDGKMTHASMLKKYVDETFHVQNDYLYQLNPREYQIVPQYILDFCNEKVDELSIN